MFIYGFLFNKHVFSICGSEYRWANLLLIFDRVWFCFFMVCCLILVLVSLPTWFFIISKFTTFLFAKCKFVFLIKSSHLFLKYQVSSPSSSYHFKSPGMYFGIKLLSASQVKSFDSAIAIKFFSTDYVVVLPPCRKNQLWRIDRNKCIW